MDKFGISNVREDHHFFFILIAILFNYKRYIKHERHTYVLSVIDILIHVYIV
jgi:hypothetical protein